ncbi:hypothetical protein FRC09_016913 [Ceratobasidium sp. 395]|nr:hypothetical protein FRC09_016913 [Ceratobasidium sp. 395]
MPADPENQRDAREFEHSLHEDVLAGRTDPAHLRLIVETAKHDKAPRVQDTRHLEPPTGPSLLDIEQNPWAKPCRPARRDDAAVTRLDWRKVEPRDLSCLRGDARPCMGIGRRKKRCRAFHAIGPAYVLHRSLALPAATASVFTVESELEAPTPPDTPPDLREASWHLQYSIYGAEGPTTPDYHSLASPELEPEPEPVSCPLYPPTPPPIEQIPVQPGELNVFGHDVDPCFTSVVMHVVDAVMRTDNPLHPQMADQGEARLFAWRVCRSQSGGHGKPSPASKEGGSAGNHVMSRLKSGEVVAEDEFE